MIEGDWTATEKDEGECESGQSQGKFVSAVAHQPIVEMNLDDGDGQINADGKGSHASEEPQQDKEAAKEFGEGGKVSAPGGKSEAGHELNVVVKAAENFVVSVVEDDGAKDEAHDEEREGLKAIEVAQVVPPGEKEKIDYSSARTEGSNLGRASV